MKVFLCKFIKARGLGGACLRLIWWWKRSGSGVALGNDLNCSGRAGCWCRDNGNSEVRAAGWWMLELSAPRMNRVRGHDELSQLCESTTTTPADTCMYRSLHLISRPLGDPSFFSSSGSSLPTLDKPSSISSITFTSCNLVITRHPLFSSTDHKVMHQIRRAFASLRARPAACTVDKLRLKNNWGPRCCTVDETDVLRLATLP